jgi:hypothetical protein
MGTGTEKLMVWQDLNLRPSIITSTIGNFQLKIFCWYCGLNPGLLPDNVFDAYSVKSEIGS